MRKINVVAAIIVRDNRILATQRGHGDFKGLWEFPGGKIEIGETPQEALVREIIEELGVRIVVNSLFEIVQYDYPEFHLTMQCFLCEVIEGQIMLKEHQNAKWLEKHQIFSVDWLPADIKLLNKLVKIL